MEIVLEYENEDDYDLDFDIEKEALDVIKKALELHGIDIPAYVSLSLCSEENIRETNKEYRNIDKVTDVLSFPGLYYEEPGKLEELPGENDPDYFDYFDPDSGLLNLGDIIICYKRATEQALEYGHSIRREILFLTAHSILHLLGYDHMEEDERIVMENKQREILDALDIKRV